MTRKRLALAYLAVGLPLTAYLLGCFSQHVSSIYQYWALLFCLFLTGEFTGMALECLLGKSIITAWRSYSKEAETAAIQNEIDEAAARMQGSNNALAKALKTEREALG